MNGQTFATIYTVIIFLFLAFTLFRSFKIIKAGRANKVVVETIQKVANEEEFDAALAANKENATSEVKTKLQLVELWGKAFHKHTDNYPELIKDINLQELLVNTNKGLSIEKNEDSFFYLCLAIPNMLYGNNLNSERELIKNKIKEIYDETSNQLVVAIGENCDKYYDGKDDKGQSFFEKVLDGDYGEYKYSKSLIGLYKEICNAMLYKIYDEKNDARKEECKDLLKIFATRGVGERWLKALNIEVEDNETEAVEETVEENIEEKEGE